MDLTKVIVRPLFTEKAYLLSTQSSPQYSFIVDKQATKTLIKMAFVAIYNIEPTAINTILRKPRPTRYTAQRKRGYSKKVKIAYITLPKGVSLDLYNQDQVTDAPVANEGEKHVN